MPTDHKNRVRRSHLIRLQAQTDLAWAQAGGRPDKPILEIYDKDDGAAASTSPSTTAAHTAPTHKNRVLHSQLIRLQAQTDLAWAQAGGRPDPKLNSDNAANTGVAPKKTNKLQTIPEQPLTPQEQKRNGRVLILEHAVARLRVEDAKQPTAIQVSLFFPATLSHCLGIALSSSNQIE